MPGMVARRRRNLSRKRRVDARHLAARVRANRSSTARVMRAAFDE
jgi:hypothetical protein